MTTAERIVLMESNLDLLLPLYVRLTAEKYPHEIIRATGQEVVRTLEILSLLRSATTATSGDPTRYRKLDTDD